MGVVLECQAIMSYVLHIIFGFRHATQAHEFYGTCFRLVLDTGKEGIEFASHALARLVRVEFVTEILDKALECLK